MENNNILMGTESSTPVNAELNLTELEEQIIKEKIENRKLMR